MNRTFKTLLIWLLMAVLPLNAAAAAIGASCGPMHRTMHTAVQGNDAHPVASAAHGLHQHAEAPSLVSQDLAVEDSSPDGDSAHSCSACSPFCLGAVAPPPAVIAPPSLGGSETVIALPSPLFAGFIPDAHKRPPRHFFA